MDERETIPPGVAIAVWAYRAANLDAQRTFREYSAACRRGDGPATASLEKERERRRATLDHARTALNEAVGAWA